MTETDIGDALKRLARGIRPEERGEVVTLMRLVAFALRDPIGAAFALEAEATRLERDA